MRQRRAIRKRHSLKLLELLFVRERVVLSVSLSSCLAHSHGILLRIAAASCASVHSAPRSWLRALVLMGARHRRLCTMSFSE